MLAIGYVASLVCWTCTRCGRLGKAEWRKRARRLQLQIVMSNYATRWLIIWRPRGSPTGRNPKYTPLRMSSQPSLDSFFSLVRAQTVEPLAGTPSQVPCHGPQIECQARARPSSLVYRNFMNAGIQKPRWEINRPSQFRATSGGAFDEQ